MKRILIAVALAACLPALALADDTPRYSHAPYERVKIDGEWRTTGVANCDQPIVDGGGRYCPSRQWPRDQHRLNPSENPIWGDGGSVDGSGGSE